jgi:hypothetical protein
VNSACLILIVMAVTRKKTTVSPPQFIIVTGILVAQVCGGLLAGIVGSNLAGGMDV